MRRRLIRAAIAMYPSRWRRRYGAELEQLILDAEASGAYSTLGCVRLAAGVAASAVAERFREMGYRSRIAAVALAAVSAGLLVNAVAIASDPASTPATLVAPADKLAVNAALGPNVQIVAARPSAQGVGPSEPRGTVVVEVDPQTGDVISITGAPVRVVMNPVTGTVLSVTPAAAVAS